MSQDQGGKFSFKNILLVALAVLTILFSALWYFRKSPEAPQNNALQDDIKRIQHERDSLALDRAKMEVDAVRLRDSIHFTEQRIAVVNDQLAKTQQSLAKATENLATAARNYQQQLNELLRAQNSPANRAGDELIRSLKEKTK